MKAISPISGYIAPECRVAYAAVIGAACGVACALIRGVVEAFGGPSTFSSRILPAACCSLALMVGLSQMGPWLLWLRSRAKPAEKADDSLA